MKADSGAALYQLLLQQPIPGLSQSTLYFLVLEIIDRQHRNKTEDDDIMTDYHRHRATRFPAQALDSPAIPANRDNLPMTCYECAQLALCGLSKSTDKGYNYANNTL